MKINQLSRSRGFTLVELLIVIAMIAVLVSLGATAVFRLRKSGDKVVVTNNLRQIQTANINYAADHNGMFVPPKVEIGEEIGGEPSTESYQWFENPDFVSQIKSAEATFTSAGIDTSLEVSLMDPAVVRERAAGYESLESSYGYTTPENAGAVRQAQIDDPARTAAFITADAAFADFGSKANIAYRYGGKAIAVYYDGHAQPVSRADITGSAATDAFWPPVETATP